MPHLNLDAIRQAELKTEPYPYLIGSSFLKAESVAPAAADFPDIAITGFHPASELPLKGTFKELIAELEGSELSQALSEKFGMDFMQFPRLITIRKLSAAHEGRIHCDSKSKVMSLLLYMNEGWDQPAAGRLRVLKSEHDFKDYAAEISPQMGTVFAFLRRDDSWHGHEPFAGERRVVQVAWIKNQEEIDRKKRRHGLSGWLKKLFR